MGLYLLCFALLWLHYQFFKSCFAGTGAVIYRQMGELWTLFEFAFSLYLTCNMVLDMVGSISRVLLGFMIFSILRLYGIKFSMN